MEKYSVLMSLYKKEKPEYLKLSIESMLKQTEKPDEIVLVEDGPLTKELYEVVNNYSNDYPGMFNIIVNEINLGLGLALNRGLENCKNELVARMDTDDISKPDRCKKQLERFAAMPELAIVGSYIDEFVEEVNQVISQRRVPCDHDSIYRYARRRSAFNHPTVMYRKSKVLSVGGYNDLKRNQDVDLFGRMLYAGFRAENINESLLWFRSSKELALRRKSWVNTSTYIATIRNFWRMGYSSFEDYVVVAVAQIGIYIMPTRLQQYVYKRFLRG